MKSSRIEHTRILLGSLNKLFKEAQRKGTYSSRDLYFLNCIQKTINFACEINMTEEELRQLTKFYFKFLSSSNSFAVQEFSSAFYKDTGNFFDTFVQTQVDGATSKPDVDDYFLGDNGEIPLKEPMGEVISVSQIQPNEDMFLYYDFRQEVEDRPYVPEDGQGILINIKRPTDSAPTIGNFTDYGSPVNLWNTAQEFFPGESIYDVFPIGTMIRFKDARDIYGPTNEITVSPIKVFNKKFNKKFN